jgi:hypothetical protein
MQSATEQLRPQMQTQAQAQARALLQLGQALLLQETV